MSPGLKAQASHAQFVHLRVRSIYSLLEGAIRPKELAEAARRNRMPAVAVTDTNNLFGAYEISGALVELGIQPITGVTLSVSLPEDVALPLRHGQPERSYASVALLVKDAEGYIQLSKLLSGAYIEVAPEDAPHAIFERLARYSNGLILLTGGPQGPINRLLAGGQPEAAERLLERLAECFGDRLYVELQRHGLPNEAAVEDRLIALAYQKDLPLVATNDVAFRHRGYV